MAWIACLNPTAGTNGIDVQPSEGLRIAHVPGCALLLSGSVFSPETAQESREPEELLVEYLRTGSALFPRLRGRFALVVDDRRRETAYVVRDPMGTHPLFYAIEGGRLYVSPRAEIVARRNGRPPDLNRIGAAAFLLRATLASDETLFAGVRRLLQGHILTFRAGVAEVERYWRPPADEASVKEADRVHHLLMQAVQRLARGPTAVFLSGGLDSALVAAVLTAAARARDLPPPLALSIAFRGTDADEEGTQREVASRLGLEHVIASPAELIGPEGCLAAALRLAETPVDRPPELLVPLYDELARLGARRGFMDVLDGTGGDEWFMPPPGYAADRVLRLDVAALVELCRASARYWPGLNLVGAVHTELWRFGLRAVARSVLRAGTAPFAPERVSSIRRARAEQRIPSWLLPEGELRSEVTERLVSQTDPEPPGRAADTQRRNLLDAENISIANEASHESEVRTGVTTGSPLLDADLIELLHRLPPRRLVAGGRAKALAREILEPEIGELARSWPRTVYGNTLWSGTIRREGARAWAEARGAPILAGAGLVEQAGVADVLIGAASAQSAHLTVAWRILSLETWLRGVQRRSSRL